VTKIQVVLAIKAPVKIGAVNITRNCANKIDLMITSTTALYWREH